MQALTYNPTLAHHIDHTLNILYWQISE